MNRRNKKGFTLLELLVVITIIAILAVFSSAAYSKAIETAKRSTCSQNLRQIYAACIMYNNDYGMFPAMAAGNPAQYTTMPQASLNLLFKAYVDDVRVFSCPSKKMTQQDLDAISPSSAVGWQSSSFETYHSSYGFSPGHGNGESVVIIAADRKGTKVNSDNHGINQGQVVLTAGGASLFVPALPNNATPSNKLGKNGDNVMITDSDIYSWGTISDTTNYFDWDSACQ